jgi:membrane-associated phospholipid phosphatase
VREAISWLNSLVSTTYRLTIRTFPRVSPLDLDSAVLRFARTRGHTRMAESFVAAFSRTGEHAACWLGLGLSGAARAGEPGRRAAWLRGVRIVAAAYVLNQAIKFSVRRRRPELPDLPPLTPTVSRLSFPSAHATTSFAAARAYSGVAPAALLYPVALAFAVSRPYLGVHYPSDVVAGAVLGTAVAEVWPA